MRYIVLAILGLSAIGCANPRGTTALEQRDYANKMHDDALVELYQRDHTAQEKVANAAGHAVFASIGTNLLLASTEGGYGVAIDHATGEKTYMKVRGGGLGIGVGSKETRQVYVFDNKAAYDAFVSASGKWTFGADAGAVAKFGDQGNGSAAVSKSGVQVYTIAKNGVSLAASFGPSRFYRDYALNAIDAPMTNPATETVVDADDEQPCEEPNAEAKAPEQKADEKTADTEPGADYQ